MRAIGNPDLQAGHAFSFCAQIREATSPTIDHTTLFPQPPVASGTEEEDPVPGLRQIAIRVAAQRSYLSWIRVTPPCVGGFRRKSARCSLVVALVAGLVWNGVVSISRLRDNVITAIGTLVSPWRLIGCVVPPVRSPQHFAFLGNYYGGRHRGRDLPQDASRLAPIPRFDRASASA